MITNSKQLQAQSSKVSAVLLNTAAVFAMVLTGCTTQSTLTAKSTGCRTGSVDILNSEYKRSGSTTQWCARCKDTTFYCVGNADKTRVQCRPSNETDKCG